MTTLTLSSFSSNAITVSIAAGAGETTFEIEINRSPDFSSDETLTNSGYGVGAAAFGGLPSNTVYYIRARAINTNPKGAWSNVIMQATTFVAPPSYTGYSIEPAILVVPEPVDQLTCTNVMPGSSAENLLTDDPMSVMRLQLNSAALVFHTSGRPIDTFALLGALANDEVTWRIRGAASVAALTAAPLVDTGVVPFCTAVNLGRRAHYHAYRRFSTPYTHAWWRIDLAWAIVNLPIRHLVVGLARQSVNYSRGAGQSMMDFGSMGRTQYGSPDRVEGWRGRQIDFALSWLSEADYQAKWADLETIVGTTKPVLALPNPKANAFLNDRLAFGDIVNTRAENVRDAKWNRTLEIRSLY